MLGYIIYYDEKSILRKEKSWESWRSKDIEPTEVENVPTEGFVLNKNGGGHGRGWDSRQAFIRVWDPRGFEFEISVHNLLFILRLCDCSKGKGLEGKFVYAWQGTELVLLPAESDDFKISVKFTKLKSQNISVKDLKIGSTYIGKNMGELLFLGRKDHYSSNYSEGGIFSKKFVFWNGSRFEFYGNIKHLAILKSETIPENFAELNENYYKSKYGSKPVKLIIKEIPPTEQGDYQYGNNVTQWHVQINENSYKHSVVEHTKDTNLISSIRSKYKNIFENNLVKQVYDPSYKEFFTKYDYSTKSWVSLGNSIPNYTNNSLWVILESGSEIEISQYLGR